MHVLCYPFKCGYLERTRAKLSTNINAAQRLPELSKFDLVHAQVARCTCSEYLQHNSENLRSVVKS